MGAGARPEANPAFALVSFLARKNPGSRRRNSHFCLEPLSKKFNEDISDERGYYGNFKICPGKNISECPDYASLPPHPGAFKLSHQKIGIKEEDNKTYFNQRSPDIFLHSKSDPLLRNLKSQRAVIVVVIRFNGICGR